MIKNFKAKFLHLTHFFHICQLQKYKQNIHFLFKVAPCYGTLRYLVCMSRFTINIHYFAYIFSGLSILWLSFALSMLNCSDALMEEVQRKLCPPMEKVNQPANRVDTLERVKR